MKTTVIYKGKDITESLSPSELSVMKEIREILKDNSGYIEIQIITEE